MQVNAQSTGGGRYLAFSLHGSTGTPISGPALVCLALIASIYWLICHRYTGIWHDAIIYNLLSVHWLNPAAYARDLFFTYGSQGSFSLYPQLFAGLIAWLDMDLANRVTVITGAMLWIAALIMLARGMLTAAIPVFVAVLLNVVSRNSYSLNGATFLLNENFATARSLAMPLALMAIAQDNAGRTWRGAALGLAATALHPLLGVWSLLIALARRISDKRLLLGGMSLAVLSALLVAYDALPAFEIMDPQWADRVRLTAPDVFAGGWGKLATDRILFWIAACWMGGRFGTPRYRRLYLVVALLAAWAVLLSQICSYWWPIHLVMAVQPSRVLWLTVVLGLCALADSAWHIYTKREDRQWLLLAVIVLYGFRDHCGGILFALMVLDSAGVFAALGATGIFRHRYAGYAALLASLLLLPNCWSSLQSDGLGIAVAWLDDYPAVKGLIFGGGGLVFVFWAWLTSRRWGIALVMVCAAPLLAYSYASWDARTARQSSLEARFTPGSNASHVFSDHIHSGSVVAWIHHPLETWFVLGTAGYVSIEQTTGIVFSKQKTIESLRRIQRVMIAENIEPGESEEDVWRRLKLAIKTDRERVSLSRNDKREITPAGLDYLCADPVVDWVISPAISAIRPALQTVAGDTSPGVTNHLYDCKGIRNPT